MPSHQRDLGLGGGRRGFDQSDDLVDVGQRDREAFEDVPAFAGLAQFEARAPHDDLAPVLQEKIAPGMAQQHLARPQHGDGAARAGIGAQRQPGGEAFEPVHQAGTRRYFCRQRTPSGGGALPSW